MIFTRPALCSENSVKFSNRSSNRTFSQVPRIITSRATRRGSSSRSIRFHSKKRSQSAVSEPTRLSDLAVQAGLVDSRNAAKRQLQAGGLRLDGEVQQTDRLVDPGELPALLSVGKRKVRLIAG